MEEKLIDLTQETVATLIKKATKIKRFDLVAKLANAGDAIEEARQQLV